MIWTSTRQAAERKGAPEILENGYMGIVEYCYLGCVVVVSHVKAAVSG